MAMRPQNRYQYVADFANDLKNVIASLPQPPHPTQPRDPNSTQPDLAEIYDAIQAAKDNAGNQGSDGPSTQPMDYEARCPNCQATLAPNSAFCPRCGTSLNPSIKQGNSQVSKHDYAAVMTQNQAKQATMARTTQQAPQANQHEDQYQIDTPVVSQAQAMSTQARPFHKNITPEKQAPGMSVPGTSSSRRAPDSRNNVQGTNGILSARTITLIIIAAIIILGLFVFHVIH
jgi:zinc-ribbon domain